MFKKRKHRAIQKECWNLNWAFIEWLKERLPVYREDASKNIDMSYHKFEYQGGTYTQAQLLDLLIELVFKLDEDTFWNEERLDIDKQILDIWSILFESMWW